MTRQYRVQENEGFRIPPLYSVPCVVLRLFVSWHPSCMVMALSFLRPDVAPAFLWSSRPALPSPPASCHFLLFLSLLPPATLTFLSLRDLSPLAPEAGCRLGPPSLVPYRMVSVSRTPTWLLCVDMHTLSLRRGCVAHPEDARVPLCKRGPRQWSQLDHWYGTCDMHVVMVDSWNHALD